MQRKEIKTATCNKCGWVHFKVSREYAVNQVKEFNEYFDSLPLKSQKDFWNNEKADMYIYENCHTCGESYTNFRDSEPGDCPEGCTIGPIINCKE